MRLTTAAGLLGIAAGVLIPMESCDIDDYDPQAIAAETDFIDSLRFDLDIPQGGACLTFHQAAQEGDRDLAVSSGDNSGVTGTLFPGANRIRVDAGSRVNVDAVGFWSAVPESFTVEVREDIVIEEEIPVFRESFPSQGTFVVLDGEDTLTVVFLQVSGGSGVSLSVNGSSPVSYQIRAFEDFIGSSAAIRERRASLCLFVLEHLLDQIFFTANTVNIIETHAGNLREQGNITFLCDSLMPGSEQDPLKPEYTRTLDWTDANNNGLPDSGDSFRWLFFDCWENDPGDLVGDLVDGLVEFSGYVVEREQGDSGEFITGFGFATGAEEPTGVLYSDLAWIKIERVSPGSFSFDPFRSFTVNGGFDISFSAPSP
jgi:hypothetical protein